MSQRDDLPTFNTARIASALDIPAPTFQAWTKMGVFDLLDSAAMPTGKARAYTVRDVYQIGIIRRLTAYRVAPRYAAIAARRAVDALDEYTADQVATLEIVFPDDVETELKVRIYGPETAPLPPSGALLTITVNLVPLFAWVKRRFDETAPAPVRLADVSEFVS